jgi:ABC-type transport system substrate-binding protein
MKRQSIFVVVALAAIALAATGCSKTATNANNANATSNTSSASNTSNTQTTNTATPPSTSSSTSPSAVMQASFDAVKRKDVAGFKKTLASADLKEMEEIFAKDGKTVDDFLKDLMELPSEMMPDKLETRNEKIEGDTASLEYKQRDGSWKKTYLVKEGGEWKMKQHGDTGEEANGAKDSGGMTNDNHNMQQK